MKRIRRICSCMAVCLIMTMGLRAQQSLDEFKFPPMKYRPIPLWFWNDAQVEKDKAVEQFRNMLEKDGYGGCAIVPFGGSFRPEYLSEEYMRLYGEIIKEARNSGARMSLYDEYGFPSGSMGAINGDGTPRFMNKYPELSVKRLDKVEYDVHAEETFTTSLPQGKLMSAVAMEQDSRKIISLKKHIKDGVLTWIVPHGNWKVICFVCVKDGDPNVDYLDPDAVGLFIKEVHQQYADRFGNDFGSVITETFFDEPTMYRAQGRMWTPEFNEKFEKEYGFSPEKLYPALWYDIGEQTAAARNLLFGFRSKLYAEGFMKKISLWAEEHNIAGTGHQDQEEIANPVSVSGDLMLCMKHQAIPGIDKIGGERPAELFYKVVSSAAYNWDKAKVMSETYGAMGNISIDEMYHVAMEQYTKGVNHLIPHAVWYNDNSVTFLPELSYRNPLYNKELPRFNRFLSRLNYLMQPQGRHIADIAMLYPIHNLQAGHYLDGLTGYYEGGVEIPHTDYIRLSSMLTDTLCRDFTYLHPEVMDDRCVVKKGKLKMQNPVNTEQFGIVIVPSMKVISLKHLRMLMKFREQGGTVIFTTQLPDMATEFNKDKEVRKVVKLLFDQNEKKAKAGKTIFLEHPTSESLLSALDESAFTPDVTFTPGAELRYIHKQLKGKNLYYLSNLRNSDCQTEIRLLGRIQPLILDPHSGSSFTPAYRYESTPSGTTVTVIKSEVQKLHSFFIVEKDMMN